MGNTASWTLSYDKYDAAKQGLREALCTLGNGYFATRGAFCEEEADGTHYPGTYLAGGYNRLGTEMVGRVIENEDLVNMPNWLHLKFKLDGSEWFSLKAVEILSFQQKLELKKGILSRHIHFKDAMGNESILEEERLVHMRFFHLAAIRLTLTPLNWSGSIELLSGLNGRVVNAGVSRYRELNSRHLDPLDSGVDEMGMLYLKMQTNQSELRIAQAARHKLSLNGERVKTSPRMVIEPGYVAQKFKLDVRKNEKLTIEKTASLYTSRDKAIAEPCLEALKTVMRAPEFAKLQETQIKAWESLWNQFDIEIETQGDQNASDRSLMVLRLHIFHLLQTLSLNTIDLDAGTPARGWHGEAYRGHVFWDELFIFPLLNLRIPKITQSLLKYRYRRLDEARHAAKEAGFAGAMFPWQSGSDGREESQRVHLNPKSGRWIPDHSHIQRHVNLAIAYNAWRFFEVTNDMEYLRSLGAELILEIARFFASLCVYNEGIGRYEIKNVMGPDEYHDAYPDTEEPGLHNNAYTNVMTVWLMRSALKLLNVLPEDHSHELCALLDLKPEEVERWKEISFKMTVPFHGDGIISQFEGYEELLEFPWETYRMKYGDIQRLDRILEAEGNSPNDYKLSKQADVLMLFYLFSADEIQELFNRLGYDFNPGLIAKNIDYYLKRTSHGSTLSRIVHSWVLSREDRHQSWNLFLNALESDVADIQGGTTPEGIHLGSMAGTVDIVQRCYAGIEPKENVIWLNPALPDNLKRLRFHVHYRGHSMEIEITQEKLKVASRYSIAESIWIGFSGKTYELESGQVREFPLAGSRLASRNMA